LKKLVERLKGVFLSEAHWALPPARQLVECNSWLYTVFRITLHWIVNVLANGAFPFGHVFGSHKREGIFGDNFVSFMYQTLVETVKFLKHALALLLGKVFHALMEELFIFLLNVVRIENA
jgi:hypothetical protein